MAHPAVLNDLVDRYESLCEALAADVAGGGAADASNDELRRRIDDVSYTLCVSTGTRDIAAALEAARRRINTAGGPAAGGTRPRDEVTLAS